jgi:hypothetical protein
MQSPARSAAFAPLPAISRMALAVPAAPPSAAEQVTSRQGTTANVGGLWCGAGLIHEFTPALARGESFTRADGGSCTH